eukprot:m.358913 g.358913  ORF g.358913 m.358913 type:complete len:122 (+) comp18337_c0_seq1:302-667(+)
MVNNMFYLGAFLLCSGTLAWALAGYTQKARMAVIVGGATGTVSALFGLLMRSASANSTLETISLYGSKGYCLMLTGVFAWRAYLSFGDPKYTTTGIIISAMCLASLFTMTTIPSSLSLKAD